MRSGSIKTIKNKEAARVAAAKAAAEQEALARAEAEREAAARVNDPSNGDLKPYVCNSSYRLVRTGVLRFKPTVLYTAQTLPVSYILKEGFLPNESYGDPSTPYGSSEYRRKSW